ncbi:MAG: hypothetical protein J7L91_03755 [Candidatus Korarchaeota archaeon]|nr:hypothetical protein [Candidatus Korarchaeota archaeon]
MRRLKVVDKVDMVCIGPERVDEYEAEGFLLTDGSGYSVVIVERDNIEGDFPAVWVGHFDDLEEARSAMRDVLYNLGRLNDRGFGCHEAPSILNSEKLKG